MSSPAKAFVKSLSDNVVTARRGGAHQFVRLPPLPTIKDIICMYNLRAMRQLSQNFLMDPRLHHKIAKAAGPMRGFHVCEVGPGPGGITRAILERGAKELIVVEKDKRFLPSLELLASASENRMKIVMADVMKFQMGDIFPKELARDWLDDELPPIHVIGNLPFNVSTPLIIRWLRDVSSRSGIFSYGRVRLTLTFQKEVAERMIAQESYDQRCRLSIMCQHLCTVQHLFTISGKAFVPKPEVDVGVVQFIPLKRPLIELPFNVVEKFMRNTFHFRQKYCTRGVEVLFPKIKRKQLTTELFKMAQVSPMTRPFNLRLNELKRMANAYYAICQEHPDIVDYDYRAQGADKEEVLSHPPEIEEINEFQ